MHYHVRITQKSSKAHDETKVDLTEEQLTKRFLVPYELGDPIIINGKTIPMDDLERIRISKSKRDSQYLIQQEKAQDRASPVLVIGGPSYEWRAADRAGDVTDDYIKGPPGYKRSSGASEAVAAKDTSGTDETAGSRVFVVHGHDHALKNDLELFLRDIGMEPIVLHRQPDEGLTVIEKFERHSDAKFAFILLTPDDVAFPADEIGEPNDQRAYQQQARQNVIFEFGYFVGKLGRSSVCCIYKEGVAVPSDVTGLLYKKVTESVEEIGYSLIKELRNAGLQPRI